MDDGNAFPVLLGDIGGTNARFSILPSMGEPPVDFPVMQTAAFATIDDAIAAAIAARPALAPRTAVLAVAGPVDGDEIDLTNCDWIVRPRQLFDTIGLSDVIVLNDFEAQALAVVALGREHMVPIGPEHPVLPGGRVVMGPGTGLGVAGLVHARDMWIPVPGEGGHVDIGPRTARDHEIWPHLEPIEGRISGEQMLCGRGLVNIYRAICAADGVAPEMADPADITAAALARGNGQAVEAVDLFVTCLGRLAGDLALVFMARGGVYLTGGIAQKIVPALQSGLFRAAFDDKAPHGALVRAMPVHVVAHPLAALVGLAAYAREPHRFGVETKGRRWRR